MRILLAGGAGFVGYHLTRQLLLEHHDVMIADDFSSRQPANVIALRHEFPTGGLEVRNADVRALQIRDPQFDA